MTAVSPNRMRWMGELGDGGNAVGWAALIASAIALAGGIVTWFRERSKQKATHQSEKRANVVLGRRQMYERVFALESLVEHYHQQTLALTQQVGKLEAEVSRLQGVEEQHQIMMPNYQRVMQENTVLKAKVATLEISNRTLQEQLRANNIVPYKPLGEVTGQAAVEGQQSL